MPNDKTREVQYQRCLDLVRDQGPTRLGLMSGYAWHDDPKHLAFTLSRYKFVGRMLSGRERVLEVGCGDAFGSRIVAQDVGRLTAVDFDPVFVRDAIARMTERFRFECRVHDILDGPVPGPYDAAYALDVLEHIPPEKEAVFLDNLAACLASDGVLILGTPSRESQRHASAASREGHVNCKDHREIRDLLAPRFGNFFLFSMNDEVVHTGFYPMAHYFFALCAAPRRPPPVVAV